MATATTSIAEYCSDLAKGARQASRQLLGLSGESRDRALRRLAELLRHDSSEIVRANELDRTEAPKHGLTAAAIDRLTLTPKRLTEMADAVEAIADFPDPIGRILESSIRPNGLEVQKVRVPLGVVFFIYESRPNVTTDAAALCLKSGNAVILRGGKEASHSNRALGALIQKALSDENIPPHAVSMVETTDRAAVGELLRLNAYIDVVIPRGGEDLIRRVSAEATMPVIKHYKGVCHVFVDATADVEMATAITENSKCSRPGVCNAAETLLVHQACAAVALPAIAKRLRARGVELRGCERTRAILSECKAAAPEDFGAEFLDLILAVRVVDDLDDAVEHIARHGSGHTETIVTSDYASARRFTAVVDSSAVMVNASTRFNDGGQFGLGAEIGISTDKFHARGPCGLNELTSYKYVALGNGQIRP
ncbi:MAG: glutamate-5-semialdehyde dehydrogenase [Planctomycetota bacterium]